MNNKVVHKRRELLLPVMILLLLSVFGGTVFAKTLTPAEKAKLKYAQYLNLHGQKDEEGYIEYFAAVSLDDNAVPDLFERTGKETAVSFMNGASYNGELRTWADMLVVNYIYPRTGVYAYHVFDADKSPRAEFLYRKTLIRTNGKKDFYLAGQVNTESDGIQYYNNAAENTKANITKTEFTNLVKEYTGTVKPVKVAYVKNTKANRKKYLGNTGEIAILTLNASAKTLQPDSEGTLKATLKNAPDGTIINWKSDKPKVVSVSAGNEENTAVLTAKEGGIATITASASGVTAVCKVTVNAPSLELDQTSVSLFEGKSAVLKAVVTGSSKTVAWKSSNTKIVTVSGGKIKGVKAGTAKITATANGLKAVCSVTVKAMKENVKGLTAVAAGKSYIIRFDKKDAMAEVTRKDGKLFINGKAVLKLHADYPAYGVYLTDIASDNYKEVLEVYRNTAGRSGINIYRYSDGKFSKYAGISGLKGSTLTGGFSYKSGQKITTPGNGTIVITQTLLLNKRAAETISAVVKYKVASGKIAPVAYNGSTASEMSCSKGGKTLKAMDLYKAPEGTKKNARLAKNAKYTAQKLAIGEDGVYVKVEAKNNGWIKLSAANVVYP